MSLSSLIGWFLLYKYAILFVLAVVEGPMVMVASGLLLHRGYASFWPLYITLMSADLVGDTFWYYIGMYAAHPFSKKYGKYFGVSEEKLNKTLVVFNKHRDKILFLSKISLGLGLSVVTLMTAGMSRVPFRRYIVINAIGQCIWTGFLMSLGYFFGNFYSSFENGLRWFLDVVLLFVVFMVCAGIKKYLSTRNVVNKL